MRVFVRVYQGLSWEYISLLQEIVISIDLGLENSSYLKQFEDSVILQN